MGKFGLSLIEAKRCTPVDFFYHLKANQIKSVDRQHQIALQAWMNQVVQSTTGGKNPKPKFRQFEKFFDYDDEMAKVLGNVMKQKRNRLAERNRMWSQSSKKGGNECQS